MQEELFKDGLMPLQEMLRIANHNRAVGPQGKNHRSSTLPGEMRKPLTEPIYNIADATAKKGVLHFFDHEKSIP